MLMTRTNLPVIGAALGLDALERHRDWIIDGGRDLELQCFHEAAVLDGDIGPVVARARTLLDGHAGRLGIHGPFWGFRLDSHDPDIRKVVQRRLLQGVDAAVAVGATQMVIHSPTSTWDHNGHLADPRERGRQVERVHATLRPVVARAADAGVVLVIENIEDKDPMVRVDLARSFDSEFVRVSLDTGHAHYAHVSTGAPPVDAYVLAAGELLAHVHLQDNDGFADRHWHPGEGSIHWRAVFAALARTGAAPRLVLEVKDQERLLDGARHLAAIGVAA
jgi:sugar phosphate isomerase/epimerase